MLVHVDFSPLQAIQRNRIGYLTGRYLTNIVRVGHYSVNDYEVCVKVISKNIAENFYHNEAIWVEGQYLPTYTETTYFVKGMTRKEWAETILAPLFLDIEED